MQHTINSAIQAKLDIKVSYRGRGKVTDTPGLENIPPNIPRMHRHLCDGRYINPFQVFCGDPPIQRDKHYDMVRLSFPWIEHYTKTYDT